MEKKDNYKIISFDTHSTASLPPVSILQNFMFFSKNPPFFQKKTKFRTFLRISLFQSHSNFLRFGDENFSISEPSNFGHFQIFNIGHYQFASKRKKCSCCTHDFPSIFIFGQKIVKVDLDPDLVIQNRKQTFYRIDKVQKLFVLSKRKQNFY